MSEFDTTYFKYLPILHLSTKASTPTFRGQIGISMKMTKWPERRGGGGGLDSRASLSNFFCQPDYL